MYITHHLHHCLWRHVCTKVPNSRFRWIGRAPLGMKYNTELRTWSGELLLINVNQMSNKWLPCCFLRRTILLRYKFFRRSRTMRTLIIAHYVLLYAHGMSILRRGCVVFKQDASTKHLQRQSFYLNRMPRSAKQQRKTTLYINLSRPGQVIIIY